MTNKHWAYDEEDRQEYRTEIRKALESRIMEIVTERDQRVPNYRTMLAIELDEMIEPEGRRGASLEALRHSMRPQATARLKPRLTPAQLEVFEREEPISLSYDTELDPLVQDLNELDNKGASMTLIELKVMAHRNGVVVGPRPARY